MRDQKPLQLPISWLRDSPITIGVGRFGDIIGDDRQEERPRAWATACANDVLDSLKSVVSRPIISWMFQLFSTLRANGNRLASKGHLRIRRANPIRKTGLD